jgi:flagellar biosynthesis component FlhA
MRPRALAATGLLLGALALVPGLPLWPFALVALGAAALAVLAQRREQAAAEPPAPSLPRLAPALEVALDPLLAAALPGLDARLGEVGATVADDLGLVVPAPALTVDARLPLRSYEVRLRGLPLGGGLVPDGRQLADAGPSALPPGIEALPAEHPATGALASWVPLSSAPQLRAAGIALLDGPACIATRLEAALRSFAPELLGLEETQRLLDGVTRDYPTLVRDVVPRRIDTATLAELLRRLVAEGLPILDLRDVLEAIARQKEVERDPALLTERVRAALTRQITHRHARDRRVDALLLDAEAEEAVRGAIRQTEKGAQLALEPDLADALLASVQRAADAQKRAVIVTSAELRRHVRRLVEGDHPRLAVLAYHELSPDVQVERVGTISLV